jgi:hypothetical protein
MSILKLFSIFFSHFLWIVIKSLRCLEKLDRFSHWHYFFLFSQLGQLIFSFLGLLEKSAAYSVIGNSFRAPALSGMNSGYSQGILKEEVSLYH